jgi:Domain of unknown function (DUF222)
VGVVAAEALDAELDALAADDLHGLTAGQLLDRTARLIARCNRLQAELARTTRAAELAQAPEHDGLKSMASWLKGHGRLSGRSAKALVRTGRALEQLPAVAAGCAAGVISAEQVAVIAPVVAPDALERAAAQGVDVAEVDTLLAQVAAGQPYDRLRQVVHHYLARLDPDGPEPDPTEGRSLTIAKHDDGSISGRFELDAVGGEKLQAALESILQANRPKGDTRSRAQRSADALVQLCDNALASGNLPVLRKTKPQVVVKVPLEDLLDPSTGAATATTGFGATLSAARARWIACDAQITRIVLGPDGQPLNLGRSQRLVTQPLRTAVVERDQTCVFAGCGAPHHWCDVHHLLEWIFGGETSLENSGLLCERHHTKVHHGFHIERDAGGRWHTYRPDGTEIRIPEPLLAA